MPITLGHPGLGLFAFLGLSQFHIAANAAEAANG